MEGRYIGIDIGGTKCAVVLGDGQAVVQTKTRFATESERGVSYTTGRICDAIDEMLRDTGTDPGQISGIGVSCGGPLDAEEGVVLSPPNLPGWDKVPIVDLLEKHAGVPTRLLNDADACALAEHRFGAGRGVDNMVFLTFGTGLGAGLILGGRLHSGAKGLAGEVGHIRLAGSGPVGHGKQGSFEGFCSGGGIAQLAEQIVTEYLKAGREVGFCPDEAAASRLTAKSVADAADAGDPVAIEIYRVSGTWLGRGLAIIIDLLNPERIVIGSIYARSEELLRPFAEAEIKKEALAASAQVCQILPAALGESLGDVASLCVAMGGAKEKA